MGVWGLQPGLERVLLRLHHLRGLGHWRERRDDLYGEAPTLGSVGPDALEVYGGFTLFVDSQLFGGQGGSADATADPHECQGAGPGGAAVRMYVSSTIPTVPSIGSTFVGGPGGASAGACPPSLPAPRAIEDDDGIFLEERRPVRSLESTHLVREGDVLTVTYTGEPFDLTWLGYSVDPASIVYSDVLAGTIYNGVPSAALFTGPLNARGMKTRNFTIIDTGHELLPVLFQIYFLDSTVQFALSNPRLTTVLDGAIA